MKTIKGKKNKTKIAMAKERITVATKLAFLRDALVYGIDDKDGSSIEVETKGTSVVSVIVNAPLGLWVTGCWIESSVVKLD